jgi:gamma-glutamyltranspeptidase/glutathione hydrolase
MSHESSAIHAVVLGVVGLVVLTVQPPVLTAQNVPRPNQRVVAEHGVVAAAHSEAAEAGLAMLRAGGNAVDAAVATAFALGVVEPMMAGVGGGGSMTIWMPEQREPWHLEFYASAGADPDSALDSVPESEVDSVSAERWVGVPGAVAGLLEAHERYGRLPRAQLLDPAIRLAGEGFHVHPLLARVIADSEEKLQRDDRAAGLFYPKGMPLGAGERLVQPALARTLERIRDHGRDGFYRGETAERVVATLRNGGSRVTTQDLARFRPRWRRPLCGTYRDFTVLTAAPPLSGAQVLETLKLLESIDLASLGLPWGDAGAAGALIDAIRIARADRDAWLGDAPEVVALTSPGYVRGRVGLLGLDPVPTVIEPGDLDSDRPDGAPTACRRLGIGPAGAALERLGAATDVGRRPTDDGETTHLSVIDSDGNAVALTFTLGGYFGYGVFAAGAFFNDAMENFGGPATNRRGPHRTPRSTTAPTIVLSGDRVRLVVGSPGGARITPAIVQTIVYALDFDVDLWTALAAPRAFPAYDSREVRLEPGFAAPVLAELRRRGYALTARPPFDLYFGGVHAVLVEDDGTMVGAADPRRDGAAVGY